MATATKTKENQELRDLLQVKPPSEAVDWINFLVYGDPGVGKTFLAGTAQDSELTGPVLIADIEGGLTTLRHRKDIDTKSIRSMKELEDLYNRLYASIKDGKIYYGTVVIDSLTELADLAMRVTMKAAYARNPDKVDIDVPSQREWGIVRNQIRLIVRAYRDLPCHVVYTAQVATLQEEGQPTKYFPGLSGKLRTEVPGFMDVVGYYFTEVGEGVIERKLQVQGTRRVVAKDRTGVLAPETGMIINPTLPMMWELISK